MGDTAFSTRHQAGGELFAVLEEGRWSNFQKRAAALAILAVVLDGFDIQLIGFALPALIRDWGVTRSALVPVVAVGLIGMSLGSLVAGSLGDRIGRRATLIGSIVVFGLATLATAWTTDVLQLLTMRGIASLGLGGALPSAVALLSEFTPRRRRSFAVTFGMVCTPLGGLIAGVLAANLLSHVAWPALFIVGGTLPLLLAVVLVWLLPESPQFLRAAPARRTALKALAARLDAIVVDDHDDAAPRQRPDVRYSRLFTPALRRDTLLLWLSFLCVLTSAYAVFNWLPTLLSTRGADLAASSSGLAVFNMGGIAGAVFGSVLIDRTGSRRLTLGYAAGAVVTTLCLSLLMAPGGAETLVLGALFVAGCFIAGLQPMLFAVAANLYGDDIRSTGVGTALAFGRLGAIASSVIGALLVGAGGSAFFAFLAVMMTIVGFALLALRKHVASAVAAPIA